MYPVVKNIYNPAQWIISNVLKPSTDTNILYIIPPTPLAHQYTHSMLKYRSNVCPRLAAKNYVETTGRFYHKAKFLMSIKLKPSNNITLLLHNNSESPQPSVHPFYASIQSSNVHGHTAKVVYRSFGFTPGLKEKFSNASLSPPGWMTEINNVTDCHHLAHETTISKCLEHNWYIWTINISFSLDKSEWQESGMSRIVVILHRCTGMRQLWWFQTAIISRFQSPKMFGALRVYT